MILFTVNAVLCRSVERTAAHDAKRKEQEATGRLERQKLLNESENEKARTKLFELQAEAAAVESSGQAKAEAQVKSSQIENTNLFKKVSRKWDSTSNVGIIKKRINK